jgi:hypothetical protein
MNIEESLNKFFNKKDLNSYQLIKLVEQVMNELPAEVLVEDSLGMDTGDSISDLLPTIKITEDWGKKGSRDKEIITEFTSKIQGETLEQKLNNLSNILTGNIESRPTLGEILSTLVTIEVLNSILVEFTEAAGGFIFEGFLAGLLGKKGIQITGAEPGGEEMGKPITDVRVQTDEGNIEYSLKLLGQSTDVKGSFSNMVIHFEKYDHIIYLDARRTSDGLRFGEFTINLENFMKVFTEPFAAVRTEQYADLKAQAFKNAIARLSTSEMEIKAIQLGKPGLVPEYTSSRNFIFSPASEEKAAALEEGKISSGQRLSPDDFEVLLQRILSTENSELKMFEPFKIEYAEAKFGGKSKYLFGSYAKAEITQRKIDEFTADPTAERRAAVIASLKRSPGFEKNRQFIFTKKQAESIGNFRELATVPVSEDALKRAWLLYGERLNNTLRPVYGILNIFTKNVNSYFLGTSTKEKDRKSYGTDAIQNASDLKTATDQAIKEVEAAEK